MEFSEKMSLLRMSEYLNVDRKYLKAIAKRYKMRVYKIQNTKKYSVLEMENHLKKQEERQLTIYKSVAYVTETYYIFQSKMNYINDL